MTLHPLTLKGGAFVLKLGLVFKQKKDRHRRSFFCLKTYRVEKIHERKTLSLCDKVFFQACQGQLGVLNSLYSANPKAQFVK